MRVSVKNFQSLADASLDVEGLTVLVGPSDLGKSALVRAVSGALFNLPGDFFVRRGASHASVTLEGVPTVDPGKTLDVTWRKGASKNEFVVDGELFSKVGSDTPAPLAAAGYREVSEEQVRPQVADQFDRLFLLDRPGSVVASVLTALSRVLVVSSADRLCAKDAKDTKKLEAVRRGDLARLDTDVAATNDIEPFAQRVQRLSAQAQAVAERTSVAATVRQVTADRAVAAQVVAVHALPEPVPVPAHADARGAVLLEAVGLLNRRRTARLHAATLPEPVTVVESVLSAAADAVETARGLARRRREAQHVAARALPPGADVPGSLSQRASALRDGREALAVRGRAAAVAALSMPSGVVDPEKVSAETGRLQQQIHAVRELVPQRVQALLAYRAADAGAQALNVEVESATAAFAQALAAAQVCALCGQPLPHGHEAV